LKTVILGPLVSIAQLAFLLGTLPFGSTRAEEPLNNDEDLTRPLTRLDVRYQFQDKASGVEQSTFILRAQQPIPLGREWEIATRADLPFVLNDGTSSDNPKGETRIGLGDFLTQFVLINTINERFACGAGLRTLYPTANQEQFGSGKYRLIPLIGMRAFLPEISVGTFFQPVVRYDFDAGGDSSRSHLSQLQMSPTVNIALPDRWFITLYPSQDIVLNNIRGHQWFVPADFLVGRNIDKFTVVSIEVSIPIVKEFTLYDFKLEARISRSF
jgi:hypothetical protein